MSVKYSTRSSPLWIIISFGVAAILAATAILGGVSFLEMPLWVRIAFGALALLAGATGALSLSLVHLVSDGDLQRAYRDALIVRIRWNGDGRALDIGTGTGLVAIGLARHFADATVVGCDTWTGAGPTQRICEQNARAEGVAERVRFEAADARALPYTDEEFDAVTSKDVFHIIHSEKHKLGLFQEALRVLQPGGAFAFIEPYGIKSAYSDVEKLVIALRAEGLTSVHFAWLDEVGKIPRLLRPIVGRSGIVYGVK